MRVGIYGGTFDPVHFGHLVAAVNARHAARLDRVLMVVANQPWQKAGRTLSPAAERFELLRSALEGVEGVEASDVEIARGGESYTADTVAELARERPGDELFLVVGADAAAGLDTWKRIDEIQPFVTLVVVNRPGTPMPELVPGWRAMAVEIPALDISSTDLRARAGDGRPLDFLLPAAAIRRIRERGLYAGTR